MGSNKVPTKVKHMRGTARQDRDLPNQVSPSLEVGLPDPPVDMTDHAKHLWKQVTAELYALRMLTRVSLVQIEQYCNNYGIYRQALRQIRYGEDITAGSRKAPAFSVLMEVQKQMRSFEDRYGLNPSSATKIPSRVDPDQEEEQEGEFDDV